MAKQKAAVATKSRPPLGEPGSGHVSITWHKDEKVSAECHCGWSLTGFWRDPDGAQWHGGRTQYELAKADYAGHISAVKAEEAGS